MESQASGQPQEVIEWRGKNAVVGSEIIHEKYGMRVVRHNVIRGDGSEGEQIFAEFTRQAVLIFPVDRENNIYLSNEFAYAVNDRKIEAAGGSVNENESLEEAAIREVREELGIVIQQESLYMLNPDPTKPYMDVTSRINNQTYGFMARVHELVEPTPDPGEDITRIVMPFAQAMELVNSGVINTSVICTCLYRMEQIVNATPEEAK